MIEVKQEWYSVADCLKNHEKFYVFGDNSIRKGKGGQAMVRDCPNTVGIITKMFPSNTKESFLTDTVKNMELVQKDLDYLVYLFSSGETLVFPKDGLGTGLANLPNCAPKIYQQITTFLEEEFKVKTKKNGELFLL